MLNVGFKALRPRVLEGYIYELKKLQVLPLAKQGAWSTTANWLTMSTSLILGWRNLLLENQQTLKHLNQTLNPRHLRLKTLDRPEQPSTPNRQRKIHLSLNIVSIVFWVSVRV